ncbi:T9SS type A sorting domain-containing protein [Hymenobacter baengnokdamensis]|uniref:T9SS type A sorting domain-containing protein n=1 Tax=Hymenobacter baengnokdamensis TaxID=2615203 RepID=UPI00124521D0|nr:T9SS type A sorting domain-containing protein [Hymenobacter baengnokdamensis]
MSIFTSVSRLALLALALPLAATAQKASSYTMVASGSNAGAYTVLEPTTTAAVRTAGTEDEGYYNNLPLGFSFKFAGTSYTTVSASTNGFLTLGQALTSATPVNNLATGTLRPVIAPLWDDISFGTAASPPDPTVDGNLYYQTTGSAGSRVFTIEWRNVRWAPGATGPVCSFFVQLFEGTNVVVFDYLQGSGSAYGSTRSASVGLAGPTSGDFISLSDLQLTATTSTTAETSTITSRATSGRIFTFTPSVVTATAPGVAAAAFQLAPNPAHGRVEMVSYDAQQPVTLHDSQGRLVRTLAPAAGASLDLSSLSPGLYIVRNGQQSRRLAID